MGLCAVALWLPRHSISAILLRHVSEQTFMSLPRTGFRPVPAPRMLLLALALAMLAGCGQKGDLYRPGKSEKIATYFAVLSQA